MARVRRAARQVRRDLVPDPRIEVFEVRTRRRTDGLVVAAATTVPAAGDAFRRLLHDAGVDAALDIRVLPDLALRPRSEALVRAPIVPVYRRPTMGSTQVTQYVMGARLTLLSRRGRFFRIRGEDAHVGWVHRGYLARGEPQWALAWERAEHGEPVVSLGAEVHDEADRLFARLPWGARVILHAGGRLLLPDGRSGHIGSGEVVAVDRLSDRFPPRGESVIRTARRWLGAPYLWGGVTPHGVDCSGLVQSVCWIHGMALPRDSDMQALVGAEVDSAPGFDGLRAGDLVFFAEKRRVDHVGLSLGGSHIIHASAGNGSVDVNDLAGETDYERFLRRIFTGARRLLPD
jgi:gamma-D-glutamyl-L-lysine dipeptidyl-peptidase